MTERVPSDPSLVVSKIKTPDENIGNPKMQGARKQRHPMNKEATPKYKGLEYKDL
jgi:hypothetical protein